MSTNDKTEPQHKAFAWIDGDACESIPARSAIAFINMTRDIAYGASVALELVERCQLNTEFDDDDARPLLSKSDEGCLLRLAISALHALGGAAEGRCNWINTTAPDWKAHEQAQRKAQGGQA